jgi:hypothetical protein
VFRRASSAVFALLILFGATSVRADAARDQSRAAFMRGVAESHQGHYTAARDAFLEAYKLFAHPSILLNLGIARWHTGEYIQAEKDLTQFLSDDGGASDEEIANARAALGAARQHLGVVRMRIIPDGARATLDRQPIALVPGSFADVRAVVGPTILDVEADGYKKAHQSVLVSHDVPTVIDLTLSPLPVGARAPPESAPVMERGTRKLFGYGALGLAAVTATVATIAGFRAIALASDYNTPGSSSFQNPSTKSTGIAFRTTSDVLFGTTLVAAGVGVYWLVFPLKDNASPKTTSLRLGLAMGPRALGIEGAF